VINFKSSAYEKVAKEVRLPDLLIALNCGIGMPPLFLFSFLLLSCSPLPFLPFLSSSPLIIFVGFFGFAFFFGIFSAQMVNFKSSAHEKVAKEVRLPDLLIALNCGIGMPPLFLFSFFPSFSLSPLPLIIFVGFLFLSFFSFFFPFSLASFPDFFYCTELWYRYAPLFLFYFFPSFSFSPLPFLPL
jgi:hypothetical protein